jgi:hypothetical protein
MLSYKQAKMLSLTLKRMRAALSGGAKAVGGAASTAYRAGVTKGGPAYQATLAAGKSGLAAGQAGLKRAGAYGQKTLQAAAANPTVRRVAPFAGIGAAGLAGMYGQHKLGQSIRRRRQARY